MTGAEGEARDLVAGRGLLRRSRAMLGSKVARQAAGFAGANVLANGIAVASTAMATRSLTTVEFGSYAFAVALLAFAGMFFEFGLFVPAARLAAVTEASERRSVIGAALLVYVPIGALFTATIFALSFSIDDWFHVHAGHALRLAAPLAIGLPFTFVLQQLAQGLDRLHVASVTSVVAQLLLVALFAVQLVTGGGLSTSSALVLRCLAFSLAALVGAYWLRPLFASMRENVGTFIREARDWGFQLFVGRVLSIGTYNMDVLMLGIWARPRSVGLYVLAGSLATVSGLPVMGMSAALFGRMARESVIARSWLAGATAFGAAAALAAWLLAEPVIRVFFSARYVDAAALVLPLALAQFLRGITAIYNTFLTAHGRGVDLRNAGIVLTLSNVGFNFALIPAFGAQGAAWASLLALAANLIAHVIFYRRSFGT
jgi:O-antigen/teichoic acid export membrane protein